MGVVEVVAPSRLGASFRWLLASSWSSNLGDGFALAAGPLLIASQTHDPRIVALASLLQRLPWLLFALHAGALADWVDRRKLVVLVELGLAIVLVLLSVSILTHTITIAIILAALFLFGVAEVASNTASQTLLPMLVRRSDLAIANARLVTGFVTVNQLIGPPIGAVLFAVGMSLPFISQAVLVGMGTLFVSRVQLPPRVRPAGRAKLRRDIATGFGWAMRHPAIRTLVLTILTFNITFGAAWSVLVLYAEQRLGLGSVGFGLLMTVSAAGGVVGTTTYGRIIRRVSLGNLMRIGLIVETFTHLALALTTTAAVAMVIFFFFGAHAFIWGTTSITIRQRAVPSELQGRVGSVNSLGSYGGLVIGAALGGPIAAHWGITAPFWFAFVGSGLFVVLIWKQLAHLEHEDELTPA
ncbi:MAG: MFS transporter [Actinomycetes bacterium]